MLHDGWSEMVMDISIVLQYRFKVMIRVWNGLVTSTKSCSKKKNISKLFHNSANYGTILSVTHNKKNCLSHALLQWNIFFCRLFFFTVFVRKEKGFKNFFFGQRKKTFFLNMFDFHGEWSFSSLKQFFCFPSCKPTLSCKTFFLKKCF